MRDALMTSVLVKLKALWRWLAEVKHAWLAAAVTALALVIALRPGTSEQLIRVTGLALQLLGISTVIWGISVTRALFGHPSFSSKARTWLTRFPLFRRSNVTAVGGAALLASTGKLRAFGTHGPGPNPTLETRIDALEKNIGAIHERITQTQIEIDTELHKITDAIKREEQLRESEDRTIREKLEATGTGGVHISAIGALWLVVGVTLSTAAPEIAGFLE